ncbi:MAG: hypothetical protein IPN42_05260 [Methylococcaceae bacterium]|nr:hypothetical protein [Methylococcaceae bacterium]
MCKQTLEQKLETITPAGLLKYLLMILVIASVLVVSVFMFYFLKFHYKLSSSNTDWGTFGDFIGGTLNPILSFLGLIALLLTIYLQSKELESTRKELERTASAQEKTEKVLAEQVKTQAKQQFEGTFFSLLEQHNKALEKLTSPSISRNKDYSHMEHIRNEILLSNLILDLESARAAIEKYNNICGHYFRVLYQLLKFVATNCPGGMIGQQFETDKIIDSFVSSDEKMYSNIVRSFLGYEVTQLLAINCFCQTPEDTHWKFKLLIERYSFLEHMPFTVYNKTNNLLDKTKTYYKPATFDNSNFT